MIINQTVRCQQIVTRLLEFSRQSLGQRTLFDLNEIITRCVDLIGHQPLFHNIEITRGLDPELPQIIGDPGQLQQVFTNLLLNAADAMNGRGRSPSPPARPGRDGVVLTFADTGPGIPREIQDKIFEPFFTTKPPGKGTGLGLSIVYGVLQRHGGSIEVDNRPGGGTIFTVKLPLDSPEHWETPLEMPADQEGRIRWQPGASFLLLEGIRILMEDLDNLHRGFKLTSPVPERGGQQWFWASRGASGFPTVPLEAAIPGTAANQNEKVRSWKSRSRYW